MAAVSSQNTQNTQNLEDETEFESICKLTTDEKLNFLIRKVLTLEKSSQDIHNINENIKQLGENLNGITDDVFRLDNQVKNLEKTMTELKCTNNNLLNRNTKLEDSNLKMKADMKNLSATCEINRQLINDLEQYGRRCMLKVRGVPRVNDENTNKIIIKLAEKLDVAITEDDLDVSHRVSQDADAEIIAKFTSRKKRDQLYQSRKSLRQNEIKASSLGFAESENRIFINESLTASNGELLRHARNKLKDHYKFIWTQHGGIKVRKETNTKIISINKKEQVNKLLCNLQLNNGTENQNRNE